MSSDDHKPIVPDGRDEDIEPDSPRHDAERTHLSQVTPNPDRTHLGQSPDPERTHSTGPAARPAAVADGRVQIEASPSTQTPVANGRSLATFVAGDLVAGRFRVVQFIAQGGMGEVYEAEDTELSERVALKTILPQIAKQEGVLERFRREIRLARKVTHPNVCRIFDLFHHELEDGERIVFLAMELLVGESLYDRLKRVGRMSPEEALPIAKQMALGLEAAHAQGIMHRDFKSANVMLVEEESGGDRVVITDFGLARGEAGSEHTITVEGGIVGTPAYMAPEQVEGGTLTSAIDVYALGIVLYEMVTGERPFVGDTALSIAVARLQQAPISPLELIPDLDKRWAGTILACLERDPGDRPATAASVLPMLEESGGTVLTMSAVRRRKNAALRWGLGALILTAAVGAGVVFTRMTTPAGGEVVVAAERQSVAVLGFKNSTGDPAQAWLSTALAEMLATELATSEDLSLVSGENVARMKVELSLPDTDSLADDTLSRVAENLGVDTVVLGSYTVLPGAENIRLAVNVQQLGQPMIAAFADDSTLPQLFELVRAAGSGTLSSLGATAVAAIEVSGSRSILSTNTEASRLYAQGLDRLRLFDAKGARELFELAVAGDDDFALAWDGLAAAWKALGYDTKAAEAGDAAFARAEGLPRAQRLEIEARAKRYARDYARAEEIYRSLRDFYPGNLDYGLRLASLQDEAEDRQAALATIATLRELPAPASDDPRIDLEEAEIRASLGDFPGQLAAAERATAKGIASGANLVVARARLEEADAAIRLADWVRCSLAIDEAKATFAEAGDRGGTARALNIEGAALLTQGQNEESIPVFESSLLIRREIGDMRGVTAVLANIGSAYGANPQTIDQALANYQEALEINREIGRQHGEAKVLNNLGQLYLSRGELVAARGRFDAAREIYDQLDDINGVAYADLNIATIDLSLGDFAKCESRLQSVMSVGIDNQNEHLQRGAREGLAVAAFYRGDLESWRTMAEAELDELNAIETAHLEAEEAATEAGEISARSRLQRVDERRLWRAIEMRTIGDDDGARSLTESITGMQPRTAATFLDYEMLQTRYGSHGEADYGSKLLAMVENLVLSEASLIDRIGMHADAAVLAAQLGERRTVTLQISKAKAGIEAVSDSLYLHHAVRFSEAEADWSIDPSSRREQTLREVATQASADGFGLFDHRLDAVLSRSD